MNRYTTKEILVAAVIAAIVILATLNSTACGSSGKSMEEVAAAKQREYWLDKYPGAYTMAATFTDCAQMDSDRNLIVRTEEMDGGYWSAFLDAIAMREAEIGCGP